MKEKLKALRRRLPKLTRGQKLARNLILCLLLAGLVCWLKEAELPLPLEWRFRLAEMENLVASSDIVATLDVNDAYPWDADKVLAEYDFFNADDTERRQYTLTYHTKDSRYMVGVHGNWLYTYWDKMDNFQVVERDPKAAVFLDIFSYADGSLENVFFVVYTTLPAAAAEAELLFRSGQGSERIESHLTGQGFLENGAGLLILSRTEEAWPYTGELAPEESVLHLILRDTKGQVIYERMGNIDNHGGWNDEN